jgi:hypothetical protein
MVMFINPPIALLREEGNKILCIDSTGDSTGKIEAETMKKILGT